MRKIFAIEIVVLIFALMASFSGCAIQPSGMPNEPGMAGIGGVESNPAATSGTKATYTHTLEGENNKTMIGKNGTLLLVDSISDREYAEMVNILYPEGLVDEQGMGIPGVENVDGLRETFIAEHTKAYSVENGEIIKLEMTPFYIELNSVSNNIYKCLFYAVSIEEDRFVFPSEWGNQPCGFEAASESGVYLAYTDLGIWKIDPDLLTTKMITANTYAGRSQMEISDSIKNIHSDWYLSWVEDVHLSPNGSTILYRTNRDCSILNDTSVWLVNLLDGQERQILTPAYHNDVVGFLTENHAVVGSLAETRITDTSTGTNIPIKLPSLPNFTVSGVSNGILVYMCYADGSSESTAIVSHIDTKTGELKKIAEVIGYLNGKPEFSALGKKVAIGFGHDPMVGVVDVMLVDSMNGEKTSLLSSFLDAQGMAGTINHFQWIDDESFIFTTQEGNEQKTDLITYGIR
jgi:hypothetical protein